MQSIRSASKAYKTTMSWVVRYCVFRLARRRRLDLDSWREIADAWKENRKKNTPLSSETMHRFMLCLYGEDEKILLELKYRSGLTVTMLIRIALNRFLGKLINRGISDWSLYWFGLKQNNTICLQYRIDMENHIYQRFKLTDYYHQPPGPLPIYLKATPPNLN